MHTNQAFGIVGLLIQIAFIIIFGTVIRYKPDLDAAIGGSAAGVAEQEQYYHYFKDILIMMIVGFGFLMTFLKRYGFSASGFNLMLCGIMIQWALIMNGTHHVVDGKIHIGINSLIGALFTLCAVLISFGAVLGKLGPTQYLVMGLIEVPVLVGNEYLGREVLHASDAGDSIFIHAFGAFFGLGCALALYKKDIHKNYNIGSVYHSDLFALIGTVFLWIYWPSFNAGTAAGQSQPRALLNTVLSLCAATMAVFIMNSWLPPLESEETNNRLGLFNMVYVQNATIAGGVAVGASCNMMIQPFGALLIGMFAGMFSVLGYRFVTPYLNYFVHDTCGVHNLHGFPSFIAAVASAIAAALASSETYGNELYFIFPALSPTKGQTLTFHGHTYVTTLDSARSAAAQGGFQIAAWCHTFLISIVAGIVTGIIIRFAGFWETPSDEELFTDDYFWEVPIEIV